MHDDNDADTDRARPHHIIDGLPVISRRHLLQARSKLKSWRAVGRDGLNVEVGQCFKEEEFLQDGTDVPSHWTLLICPLSCEQPRQQGSENH